MFRLSQLTLHADCDSCANSIVIASGITASEVSRSQAFAMIRNEHWSACPKLKCSRCNGWEVFEASGHYTLRGNAQRLYGELTGKRFERHSCTVTILAHLMECGFFEAYRAAVPTREPSVPAFLSLESVGSYEGIAAVL